ncbi:hypothetical protein SEA_LYMARA_100 [Arthrobacter phage Lymara]|uniref:Uncharacterized protein n=1 Tax=Arthrobacter phage Lymara TaxID=2599828 RepID=A0A5J6TVS3_9CAUD|nr:hypothetical protein HYQ01_gp100 [Arthrobacter phage Lymara]QFG14901.1 hypothetical protein SEA_LYMARA_100 [Arthrobacter phage Lymara]
MTLTPGFIITNVETTSTGYYHLEFVSADGKRMASATQHGNGGSNVYRHGLKKGKEWGYDTTEAFDAWLEENAAFAAAKMRELEQPELAYYVEARDGEWDDIVMIAILDAVDMQEVQVHKNRRAS